MAKPIDNPLDSGIDLGFVNFIKHPSDPDYVVFRFKDKTRADFFEKELKSDNTWFEKGEETTKKGKQLYLFGIHKDDFKKVQRLNFKTEAEHRTFIIKNGFFRWFLLIFVGLVVLLAIVGGIVS